MPKWVHICARPAFAVAAVTRGCCLFDTGAKDSPMIWMILAPACLPCETVRVQVQGDRPEQPGVPLALWQGETPD